jgi:phosphoenolpyruvate carboxykinase (GTP)
MADRPGVTLPKVFHVNWFRRLDGRWLWPGFGDNIRVLAWVFQRTSADADAASAIDTPIGLLPGPGALDVSGLAVSEEDMAEMLRVDVAAWTSEVESIAEYFARFDRLPGRLREELDRLSQALSDAVEPHRELVGA